MMASKLSQPPLIPPQCLSINSCNGIDMVSSTVVGVLTCPEILNNLVPVFLSRPKLENQPGPRRQIVGERRQILRYLQLLAIRKDR